MTIEEIAAELPNLDEGTLAAVRHTIIKRDVYIGEFQLLRKAGRTWEAIEAELNGKLTAARYASNANLIGAYEWKLEVLKQMKGEHKNDKD